jgi:hypothetical protein
MGAITFQALQFIRRKEIPSIYIKASYSEVSYTNLELFFPANKMQSPCGDQGIRIVPP